MEAWKDRFGGNPSEKMSDGKWTWWRRNYVDPQAQLKDGTHVGIH
jgi:hypothetical protein